MKYSWLFIIVLLIFSCKEATEMVEVKNDAGVVVEKFEIRKKDGVKNGIFERYDEKGLLTERSNYKEGVLDGERTFFYESGNPMEVETYENGLLNGEVITYYESGAVKAQIPYIIKNGETVLEGTIKTFYENGQLKDESEAKNSEIDGKFVEYYENGNIKARGQQKIGMFADRVDHGLLELFDSTGTLVKKMECDMGRCSTIVEY